MPTSSLGRYRGQNRVDQFKVGLFAPSGHRSYRFNLTSVIFPVYPASNVQVKGAQVLTRKFEALILLALLASLTTLIGATQQPPPDKSMTQKYPSLQDMPDPIGHTKSNVPHVNRKTNACYISLAPPSGCYYHESHPIGDTCFCSNDQGTLKGTFM